MENYSNSPMENPMNQSLFPQNKNMNMFMLFAILCAILSWTCSCFAPVTIIFGALSIIFALLSKGKNLKTTPAAKITIISAVLGMIFSIVTTVYSIYNVFSNPEEYERFMDQYEMMTGQSFEEELNTIKELYHIP